ncbi:MAG TPA: bifunctional 5,10-methylenetetrahydrofolate dehydrogenase/5,10-methenyltetrahydrofolate cyclohydrolase [Pyrinomonadaceae bacterium]|jgi:methylenetetrahydrofolate dehydrogenase (NADP+)/methenyltetrahydrofolate cyclohydrolase
MMIAETSRQRAELLGGAPVAEAIKTEVAAEVERLFQTYNFRPCLAAVRVGTDPASEVYVSNKIKTSREIGLISEHHALPETASHEEVLRLVEDLNRREDVDGILVQLPLPPQINANEILESIAPEKDVDGFHPINVGRLASGLDGLTPCTPAGVIELLKRSSIEIRGSRAVVVGRSNIVGRPMAQMLLKEDATVTICHSRTGNLREVTRQADILVAAIGKPAFVRGEHIKPGATVIDVGINRISDVDLARDYFDETEIEKRLAAIEKRGSTIVGDVHPREAMAIAGKFTPVPGGVGLLTVAMLMKNTLVAAKRRRNFGF